MYTKNVSTVYRTFGYIETEDSPAFQTWTTPWLFEFYGTKSGSSVPGYKQLIAEGANASSPFTCDVMKIIDVVPGKSSVLAVQIASPYKPWNQTIDGFVRSPVPVTHLAASAAKADSIALTKIYKKIQSELSTLAGASSLAEFGDVIRQFGSPFSSIIDLTNKRLNRLELERRGLKGTAVFKRVRWAQIVASTWLEYAFGLAPLISDTKKAAEALARWQLEHEVGSPLSEGAVTLKSKAMARAEDEIAVHNTENMRGNHTKMEFLGTDRIVTTARCQYVVGLRASLQAEVGSQERLQQLLGFQPIDWLPAAWEVVPWSWLIDYFTNVGDILKAAATSTANVTWISKTVSTVTERTYHAIPLMAKTAQAYAGTGYEMKSFKSSGGGSWKVVRTTVNRTVPLSLGVPPVYLRLPSMVGQYANMAAVLIARKPQASALWVM